MIFAFNQWWLGAAIDFLYQYKAAMVVNTSYLLKFVVNLYIKHIEILCNIRYTMGTFEMEEEAMNRLKQFILDIGYDLVGTSLCAIGIMVFSSPNHIAPGGASGVATLVNYLTGIPIGTMSMLINIPLLLIGYRSLGKRFTLNTLRTVLVSTLMLDYVWTHLPPYRGDVLLAALFAGVFSGAGVGVIFMHGSTTGGSDIITKMILKKHPYYSAGKIVLYINGFVMILAAFVYQNIEAALYGLIMTFTSGKVLDGLIYGANVGKYVTVITKRGQQVADVIIEQLHRGVTILAGKGAYTQEPNEMLVCVVRKQEFYRLKNAIYSIDPAAFIVVTEANDIIGKGFHIDKPEDNK